MQQYVIFNVLKEYCIQRSTDSEFKKLDNKLLSQINELNQITREINIELNNTSPVFSTDLSRQHAKNSKTKQTPRDQYNYNLLKDGLHPGIHLSKVWLKKLELQIRKDCWENWH
jgi:glutamate synthase domain-containing protein 3